jgi:hypothetical protein
MSALLVGYARCSTDAQDLTAQRDALATLGVSPERISVDHGLTGTNRERPGLREALAACRAGDTLVVREGNDGSGLVSAEKLRGAQRHQARAPNRRPGAPGRRGAHDHAYRQLNPSGPQARSRRSASADGVQMSPRPFMA